MTTIPIVLLVTAASGLGAFILYLWFKRARKPVLIGFHVLLGLGSTETLVVFLHQSGFDEDFPPRRLAMIAALCLAGAIASGFIAPVIGRSSYVAANWLLGLHVAAGLGALVMVLVFVSQL